VLLLSLIELDRILFESINVGMSNGVFDAIIPWIRNKYVWIPMYVFLIGFLLLNFGKRGYYTLLCILLTVASSDLISSRLIKTTVERIRPCNSEELFESINVLIRCGSGFSFTSSHAANHFALATFFILWMGNYFGNWKWLFAGWAFIIAFAQVYVGVHYPMDVFAGGILGVIIGKLWFWFYQRNFRHPLMAIA